MSNELTCNQVLALMSFYVEDKINQKLKKYIDEHLKKCPSCRTAYMKSKKIANHILSLGDDEDEKPYQTKQYEDFKQKLSAYIDNELDENENLRIKKITISNPLARNDLEKIYTLKKVIHESFDKTKNDFKSDYSKQIINLMNKENEINNTYTKIMYSLLLLIIILTIGLIFTLNFQTTWWISVVCII